MINAGRPRNQKRFLGLQAMKTSASFIKNPASTFNTLQKNTGKLTKHFKLSKFCTHDISHNTQKSYSFFVNYFCRQIVKYLLL